MGKILADPGQMNRRVQIFSNVVVQDATGAGVETWVLLAEVWCARWYVRGVETDAAEASTQQVTTGVKFIIRYRSDVLTNMLLTCEGQDFNITGIEEIGRREGLALYAIARAA